MENILHNNAITGLIKFSGLVMMLAAAHVFL